MTKITIKTTIAILAAFLTASPGISATYDNYVRIYNIEVTQSHDYGELSGIGGNYSYGFSSTDVQDFYTGTVGSDFAEKWRLIDDWYNSVWFDQSAVNPDGSVYRLDFSDYYSGPFIYSDLLDFTSDPGDPWEVRTSEEVEIYWNAQAPPPRMMLSTFANEVFLSQYDLSTRIEFDYEANITNNEVKLGVISNHNSTGVNSLAVFGAGQHSGHGRFVASSSTAGYYPSVGFALGAWSNNIIIPEPSIILIALSAFIIRRKK
jgi:hypothetical protein